MDDARVQRPIICDLDDVESLLALAEEGKHLPELLSQFLRSGAKEFPPRNWVSQAYGHERRPSFVEDQYQHAMDDVIHMLFGVQRPRDDTSPSPPHRPPGITNGRTAAHRTPSPGSGACRRQRDGRVPVCHCRRSLQAIAIAGLAAGRA
jgi:hypothetical protein